MRCWPTSRAAPAGHRYRARSLELFERFGDRQAAATSRLLLGFAELQFGGAGAALLAIVLSRRTGLRRGIAFAHNEMGGVARARGDLERARQLHQEALATVREILGWSVPHTLGQRSAARRRGSATSTALKGTCGKRRRWC